MVKSGVAWPCPMTTMKIVICRKASEIGLGSEVRVKVDFYILLDVPWTYGTYVPPDTID